MDLEVHPNIIIPEVEVKPTRILSVSAIFDFWPKLGKMPNFGIVLPKISHASQHHFKIPPKLQTPQRVRSNLSLKICLVEISNQGLKIVITSV